MNILHIAQPRTGSTYFYFWLTERYPWRTNITTYSHDQLAIEGEKPLAHCKEPALVRTHFPQDCPHLEQEIIQFAHKCNVVFYSVRRDKFTQFLSSVYAKRTKFWTRYTGIRVPTVQKIQISIPEIEAYNQYISQYKKLLDDINIEPYRIYYEDIENHQAEILNKYPFWQGPSTPIVYPLQLDYKKLVLNYEEAYCMFKRHFQFWND